MHEIKNVDMIYGLSPSLTISLCISLFLSHASFSLFWTHKFILETLNFKNIISSLQCFFRE